MAPTKDDSYRVLLIGLGAIGEKVADHILRRSAAQLREHIGRPALLVGVGVRDPQKARPKARLLQSHSVPLLGPKDLARRIQNDPLNVVVDATGDSQAIPTLLQQALRRKISVVTANKKSVAEEGHRLIQVASENATGLYFEAAVCGAIPIVRLISEYISANPIQSIVAVLNGTCNFVLSHMDTIARRSELPAANVNEGDQWHYTQKAYDEALEAAQRDQLAESDPRLDVEGYDACYKLAILSFLAFGVPLQVAKIHRHGIVSDGTTRPLLHLSDFVALRDMSMIPKLCSAVRVVQHDNRVCLVARSQLMAVPLAHDLAGIEAEQNGVLVNARFSGDLFLSGKGAGPDPTATAILADIVHAAHVGTGEPRHIHMLASQHPPAGGEPDIRMQTIEIAREPYVIRLFYDGTDRAHNQFALSGIKCGIPISRLQVRPAKSFARPSIVAVTRPVSAASVATFSARLVSTGCIRNEDDFLYMPILQGGGKDDKASPAVR